MSFSTGCSSANHYPSTWHYSQNIYFADYSNNNCFILFYFCTLNTILVKWIPVINMLSRAEELYNMVKWSRNIITLHNLQLSVSSSHPEYGLAFTAVQSKKCEGILSSQLQNLNSNESGALIRMVSTQSSKVFFPLGDLLFPSLQVHLSVISVSFAKIDPYWNPTGTYFILQLNSTFPLYLVFSPLPPLQNPDHFHLHWHDFHLLGCYAA